VVLAEAVTVAVVDADDVCDALGVADTLALDVTLRVLPALLVSEPVAVVEPVDVADAAEVGLADSDVDTVAEGVSDGVGASGRTAMLSTRSDESPPATPSPLTTENRNTTNLAGGSTALPCSQPERPLKPTLATLMLNSTVVVTSPEAAVDTAATCATSLRKSRAMKKQSHATSTSAGTCTSSESVVGTPASPAVSDTM